MMYEIVRINPHDPGAYAPLLAGAGQSAGGEPMILGYSLGGAACGVLVADCLGRSLLLRWICVDAFYRERGIAGRLLETFLTRAKQASVVSVDAVVCLEENGHRPAEALLRLHAFVCAEARPVYRLPLSSVLTGPLASAIQGKRSHAVPLHTLSGVGLRNFNHDLARSGYAGIRPEELLPESRVWVEHDSAQGCILFAPCGGDVELRWIYGHGPGMLRGLSAAGLVALAARYSPETMIHAAALEPRAGDLLRRIAGSGLKTEASIRRWRLDLT